MGSCGSGVGRAELLEIVNTYIHRHTDERMLEPATMRLGDEVLKGHSELTKLVSASSMDPQRAKQATTETRDAVFYKLDSYVKTLHAMGLCEWESFKDVDDKDKINMDEVGTDTTKHRSKIICDAAATIRHYSQTNPGDGKMNMHITCCLTTRADGKYPDG